VDYEAMNSLIRIFLIAVGLAFLIACGVLWIALSHNAQQEFYGSELGVDWQGIATLWGMSFGLAFGILAALLLMGMKLRQSLAHWKARARATERQ
jgi:hypothetical protein